MVMLKDLRQLFPYHQKIPIYTCDRRETDYFLPNRQTSRRREPKHGVTCLQEGFRNRLPLSFRVANVALHQPVSTTLRNDFGQSLSLLTNGNTITGEWSSSSLTGAVSIALASRAFVEKVIIYWSGTWGAGTNSFAVVLQEADAGARTVYETTHAPAVLDRVDALDLIALGTASWTDRVVVELRGRSDNGYAIYEIEAYGRSGVSSCCLLKRSGKCNTGPGGVRITKCYPLVVCSILGYFASCFKDSPPVQRAVGVSPNKALLRGLGSAVEWH